MSEGMVPKVYAAIVRVTESLGKEGISKDRKNVQQGYSFRGIDDVYNALSSALSEAKLCILPEVLERICEERKSSNDKALFYVTVRVKFSLVSAEDGSKVDIITYGEAMDSGDKATNKAMSAAYKYAAMQAFCIPTEGDNDADNTTHTVEPATKPPIAKAQDGKTVVLTGTPTIIQIDKAHPRVGKGPYKITDTSGVSYATFDDKVFDAANAAIVSGASVKVKYTTDKYGYKLTSFEVGETREPGADG